MSETISPYNGTKKGLLAELQRLAESAGTCVLGLEIDSSGLSDEEMEIAHLIKTVISNCRAGTEYEIVKYKLANDALNIALWDVASTSGDPYDPSNIFVWAQEFRHMLGFTDESDFPNNLYSWSDRIHPEDHEMVFAALMAHLNDYTGRTPFNIEYRIMKKNGDYIWLQAFGTTLRNSEGIPRRVAGATMDISEKKKTKDALHQALDETKKTLATMTNILNNSSAMIYVTDPDTNEILFINEHMKKHYGIEGGVGDICYKVLQDGMNERCDFCPSYQLDRDPGKIIFWEEHSSLTKRFYHNTDQYVDWPGGKKVHIQHSFDITSIKETQNELEHSKKMLYAVNSAASLLLDTSIETFESALHQSMKYIAEAVEVDRMYIWKNFTVAGQLYCAQVYEWSENAEPQQGKEFTLKVSYNEYASRWEEYLSNGKSINSLVREMPLIEQELLLPQGIVSILVMPVLLEDQFWGFVGFDDCRNERIFTKEEESILQSASLLFAAAVVRAEMQQEIFEEQKFNYALFEAAPIGVTIFDDKYECLACSGTILDMLQTTEKDFRKNIFKFSPEYQPDGQKSRDIMKKFIEKVLRGEPQSSEWILISATGECIPCEITMIRTKKNDRYVVLVYAYDLRRYKLMEKETNKANRRAKLMLDSTPLICILRDENNKVIDCNDEAIRVLGVSEKADLIHNFRKYNPEFQPDGSKSLDKINEIFGELMRKGSYDSFEWTLQDIKGEKIPVEKIMVAIDWEGKRSTLSYARDLREIKTKEKELKEIAEREREERIKKEAAQASNESKSRFLAHMSHEIRTPMNAILGMSELLMQEILSTRQRRYLEDINTSAKTLLDIINDILDVSRLHAGKLFLVPVHYEFKAMVDSLESMVRFLIEEKNIIFRLDVQKNMPVCLYGDDVRLKQVLLNVLSNAIKFTEKGYVQLSAGHTDTTLNFTVSDTGIGIPSEKIPMLFEAFEQADTLKNRKTTGTGLGLTITKAIVDMMGGQISIESEYGKGTTVYIEIPKVLGDKTQILQADNKEFVFCAPDAKVLVVDDNQINLNVACGLLQMYKINAETAKSGKQAIEMIQQNQYDIVFMDHLMPEMTGVEATGIIRSFDAVVPIIALTASAVVGAKEMMLEAGMNDYLAKPIIRFELKQILKKWIPAEKILNSPVEAIADDRITDEGNEEFWNKLEQIKGLSVTEGLDRVDGQRIVYEKTLKLMTQENKKSMNNLSRFLASEDMTNFRIEVHGLKGALASIGAAELSEKALELETASAKLDAEFCNKNLPVLLEKLDDLNSKLTEAFSMANQNNGLIVIPPELPPLFQKLTEAFPEMDLVRIDEEMEKFDALELSGALKDEIEQIKDFVLMMDYDSATEHIQKLLDRT